LVKMAAVGSHNESTYWIRLVVLIRIAGWIEVIWHLDDNSMLGSSTAVVDNQVRACFSTARREPRSLPDCPTSSTNSKRPTSGFAGASACLWRRVGWLQCLQLHGRSTSTMLEGSRKRETMDKCYKYCDGLTSFSKHEVRIQGKNHLRQKDMSEMGWFSRYDDTEEQSRTGPSHYVQSRHGCPLLSS
jgi:hypothetical protein